MTIAGIAELSANINGNFFNKTHSNPDGVLIKPGNLLKYFMELGLTFAGLVHHPVCFTLILENHVLIHKNPRL